jgi:hypothetical protein
MRQPFQTMGQQAVNLLLHQINPSVSEDTLMASLYTHILDVELIVRQSVGPPPKETAHCPKGIFHYKSVPKESERL